MRRVLLFCLRVLMFFLIGTLVTAMDRALGVSPDESPWIFVGSGLGAVVAVDVWLRWMARRHAKLISPPSPEDDVTLRPLR